VFTDVDLAIDRGSRVVVLGLNGAGKTTLLRMLAGVDDPDTGQVEPGTVDAEPGTGASLTAVEHVPIKKKGSRRR
jgi:ABC-type Fe3+/spermidine/putrescine transport system ATPase subunit